MSRKDYIAFAEIIAGIKDYSERKRMAFEFANLCEKENSHFDRDRFVSACGIL